MPSSEIYVLDQPPTVADFTPLSDHEAQTPTTFFGGKPVLHAQFDGCNLLIRRQDLRRDDFKGFATASPNGEEVEGDGTDNEGIEAMSVVTGVDGFITSESLILIPTSTTNTPKALSVPYPTISLHATQRLLTSAATPPSYYPLTAGPATGTTETQAVYLQLSPSDPSFRDPSADEDESETIELLLAPRSGDGNSEKVKEIFEALSRCADLHPDAGMLGDDEEDEGMQGIGEGGWITAENMHEFEGQFGGDDDGEEEVEEVDGGLGEGAGTRRQRDEEDDDGVNGDRDEETKWQRTD